jgi:outer membrane immunogenic protein
MTKMLLAAVSFGALASQAIAADMPPVPLPPPVPVCIWCGFYVGGTIGYTNAIDTYDTAGTVSYFNPANPGNAVAYAGALATIGTASFSPSTNGFIGGAQAGYNWQFGGFLAGLETDFQGLVANGSRTVTPIAPLSMVAGQYTGTVVANERMGFLGTVRGRAGFVFAPTWLFYATGGLAYGSASGSTGINATVSSGNPPFPTAGGISSFSGTRAGWTAGAGFEWMFAPGWIARAEYLHYDLGTATSSFTLTQTNLAAGGAAWGSAVITSTRRFDGEILRAGVNYKF